MNLRKKICVAAQYSPILSRFECIFSYQIKPFAYRKNAYTLYYNILLVAFKLGNV